MYEPSSVINPDSLYKSVTPARYPLFFAIVNSLDDNPLNITLTLCASSGNRFVIAFGNLNILARISLAEICLSTTSLTPSFFSSIIPSAFTKSSVSSFKASIAPLLNTGVKIKPISLSIQLSTSDLPSISIIGRDGSASTNSSVFFE